MDEFDGLNASEPALADDSPRPPDAAADSEARYFSLFKHASEAMVSFRPHEGTIIDANVQAERLLGHASAAMTGMNFRDLFAAPHHEQVQWLLEQSGGSANLRLEDVTVKRSDGLFVPVSLSCNWLQVDGVFIAQVIMHDMTQQRQIQRELRSYAEQLEARVAQRAGELKLSEERYRTLFFQEQQRGRHLSLINDVQRCALETRDIEHFLHRVTAAIQAHFRDCDVTFYLQQASQRGTYNAMSSQFNDTPEYSVAARAVQLDFTLSETAASLEQNGENSPADNAASTRAREELVVVAQTGGHGLSPEVGARVSSDSLPGLVTDGQHDTLIINDVPADLRYRRLHGTHRDPGAQICVAVRIKDDLIGVVSVQSERTNHFDPRDGVALQTAATIAAAHVQAIRIFLGSNELKEFNQTLIGTMLHSLMVVDRHGLIQIVNERLCQTMHVERADYINASFARVLGEEVIEQHDLRRALRDVTEHGATREIPEVRVWTSDAELYFDLRISRVYFRGQAQAVILMINLTQRFRQTRQLQLINEMGRFLQASLDIVRVLRTTLICITAGPALGFNRAFLLLLDENGKTLRGAMAIGPSSEEEAARLWREMGRREKSLSAILADESASEAPLTPLQESVRQLAFEISDPRFEAIARAIRERQPLCVPRGELISRTCEYSQAPAESTSRATQSAACLEALLVAPETAIAPLASKDRVVGVVLVDNLYSLAKIEESELRLLGTLAQQAGLTLDNALTYQALQKAQRDLVSAERLVAVGEMAARVSHEIRNPLATIGGFARNILRKPDDVAGVVRKSGIIIEEVSRLEELLGDLLDMARASELEYSPQDINALVEHALLLADADIKASGVEVRQNLEKSLPALMVDRRRLLQALLNTVRNAAQAMPEGGTLTIATRLCAQGEETTSFEIEVSDTGPGIPEKVRKQVFDPFFSTKIRGSGLGLAVTLRIIRDHGGEIDVFSEEGQGTSFVMSLTLPRAETVSSVSDTQLPVGEAMPAPGEGGTR